MRTEMECQFGEKETHHALRRRIPGHIRSLLSIAILLLLPFFFLACPLYNPAAFVQNPAQGSGNQNPVSGGGQPNDVQLTASQATLAWDPPASGPSVVSYTISYRLHGTSTWTTLATIPASSQPSYTVLRSAIGPGSFDFAVASVDSTGVSSPLHTSLDSTADPSTGWYLTW
jgi:hypothetical protein